MNFLPRDLKIFVFSHFKWKEIVQHLVLSKEWYSHLSSNQMWSQICRRHGFRTRDEGKREIAEKLEEKYFFDFFRKCLNEEVEIEVFNNGFKQEGGDKNFRIKIKIRRNQTVLHLKKKYNTRVYSLGIYQRVSKFLFVCARENIFFKKMFIRQRIWEFPRIEKAKIYEIPRTPNNDDGTNIKDFQDRDVKFQKLREEYKSHKEEFMMDNKVFTIFVKTPTGMKITLDVLRDDKCWTIKHMIEDKLGIRVSSQRLLFEGNNLNDNFMIKSYRVVRFSEIHLLYRLGRGG